MVQGSIHIPCKDTNSEIVPGSSSISVTHQMRSKKKQLQVAAKNVDFAPAKMKFGKPRPRLRKTLRENCAGSEPRRVVF